jgi:hypothetical protein
MFSDNKLTGFGGVDWSRLPKLSVLYCERNLVDSPAALAPLAKCASLKVRARVNLIMQIFG